MYKTLLRLQVFLSPLNYNNLLPITDRTYRMNQLYFQVLYFVWKIQKWCFYCLGLVKW